MKISTKRLLASTAAIVTAFAWTAPAYAQATDTADDEQDIVVTANKREQKLQDVPIAVTAVTGEQAAEAGVVDTERLAQVAPSLNITSSQQVGLGAQIRIRGVGTATGNPALEGSVGYFIDGVYVGRSNTAFTDLVDVERIEVLRGPQGTLFGKNTSAGVISVITRSPSYAWEGRVSLAGTELGGLRGTANVSGPIVQDRIAFSLSGKINQRDGYMHDVTSGADYNDRDRWLVRGQLMFDPSSNFSLRLIAEQSERDEHSTVPSFVQITASQKSLIQSLGGAVPDPTAGSSHFDTAVNAPFTAATRDTGYTADATWTTGFGKLRAIIGYRDSLARKNWDSDLTSIDVYRQTDSLHDKTFSAELQFTRQSSLLDLLIGAYYFDTSTRYEKSQTLGPQGELYFKTVGASTALSLGSAAGASQFSTSSGLWAPGTGMTLQDTRLDGKGWSVFTHSTLHITDWFDITGGLRYQWEEKEGGSTFTYNQPLACTKVFTGTGSATANAILSTPNTGLRSFSFCAAATPNFQNRYVDDRVTGTAIASFHFSGNVLGYLSYARGFKAGGINLDTRAGTSTDQLFKPETVDSYEAGFKTSFNRGRIVFNVAGFLMKFHDYQLNSFTPTTAFVLTNQGSVKSYGVEAEGALKLVDGLWLRGGVTWNVARYGEDTTDTNLRGRIVSNAPQWAEVGSLSYVQPSAATGWGVFGRADVRHQSSAYTASNLDARSLQGAYTVVNVRGGIRNGREGLEFAVFANNVGDERYKTIAFTVTGGYMSYWAEPRIIGIEISKRW